MLPQELFGRKILAKEQQMNGLSFVALVAAVALVARMIYRYIKDNHGDY